MGLFARLLDSFRRRRLSVTSSRQHNDARRAEGPKLRERGNNGNSTRDRHQDLRSFETAVRWTENATALGNSAPEGSRTKIERREVELASDASEIVGHGFMATRCRERAKDDD